MLLPKPVRALLYRFKLAGTLLKGRWWTFVAKPTRPDGTPTQMGCVWGAPIRVQRDESCAEANVDEVHAEFLGAVQGLFDRHKARFGYAAEETIQFVTASHQP